MRDENRLTIPVPQRRSVSLVSHVPSSLRPWGYRFLHGLLSARVFPPGRDTSPPAQSDLVSLASETPVTALLAGWTHFIALDPPFLAGPASLERAMTVGEVFLLVGRRHINERTVVKVNKKSTKNSRKYNNSLIYTRASVVLCTSSHVDWPNKDLSERNNTF